MAIPSSALARPPAVVSGASLGHRAEFSGIAKLSASIAVFLVFIVFGFLAVLLALAVFDVFAVLLGFIGCFLERF
jgi:hypothetical protein